jgi:hypothetical protein
MSSRTWIPLLAVALIVPVAARALPSATPEATQLNTKAAAPTTARISLSTPEAIQKATGPGFRFVGSTANLTTTATQRILGAATISFSVTGTGGTVWEALCYKAAGTTQYVTPFAGGTTASNRYVLSGSGTSGTSTVTDSVVPGAGTWEVGRCLVNQANSVLNVTEMTGWFQVTAP